MWTLDVHRGPPMWRPAAETSGPRMAFSTRRGGVSLPPFHTLNLGRSTLDRTEAVEENRRRVLLALDLDPARLATAGQVHGADVIRARHPGLHPNGDGLVTTEPGLTLAVTSADCLPILYSAPGAVAAVHAGWRGAAAGAPVAGLLALCASAGVGPERVRAHFGPCIRDCCYAVGADVARRFPQAAIRTTDGMLQLSIPAAVRVALMDAGVSPDAILDTGACTACEPHWYFSHRRDGGATGRHWGVIALPDEGS